jgi:alpha-ketoglutarate-dependent 2,4-dichlorophenoxyacetate dioxygenase
MLMTIAAVLQLRPIHPLLGAEVWMWEDRAMLHRGRAWEHAKQRRITHRTTVAGEDPTA